METKIVFDGRNQGSPEHIPSLFKYASSNVIGFDTIPSPHEDPTIVKGIDGADTEDQTTVISMSSATSSSEPHESEHRRTISISMPSSPSGLDVEQSRRALFNDIPGTNSVDPESNHSVYLNVGSPLPPGKPTFHSQPLQTMLSQSNKAVAGGGGGGQVPGFIEIRKSMLRTNRFKDKRYDPFKTWSGKLERQISNLRGKPQEPEAIIETLTAESEAVPAVDRYFDALEGPELETLKSSEELVLPEDQKWPFLLRFPISSFGMCLGVSSQAILWKTLATTKSLDFLRVSLNVNLVLWCISLVLLAVVAIIYSLKVTFYFEAVRREYYHPVRVNFFFAPWIACLFVAIGLPPTIAVNLHASAWYVLMTPILCLELKIYGQWMSGGQRRLSKVANPSNHLSVVGNFVGALLGASMGLKEGPTFFFAIGLAHYTVLFVTLYQRLPTNETLPKELHPVFFLFVAAPSVACMAWAKISGEFDYGSRLAYFIALFLYISLAVRVNFFRGFRFSLAWWAYTFPMTGAAIATIRYSSEVNNWLTEALSIVLSAISTITVSILLVSTILHAFVFHDLFPNDISIAIKGKRPKSKKNYFHRRNASSEAKDVEAFAPV